MLMFEIIMVLVTNMANLGVSIKCERGGGLWRRYYATHAIFFLPCLLDSLSSVLHLFNHR
jgi:hypothetical protein